MVNNSTCRESACMVVITCCVNDSVITNALKNYSHNTNVSEIIVVDQKNYIDYIMMFEIMNEPMQMWVINLYNTVNSLFVT